jgi:hypothetical protein
MINDPSPREQRRGTRNAMLWGVGLALVLAGAVTIGPLLYDKPQRTNAAPSQQAQGESQAGRNTEPLPSANPQGTSPDSLARNGEILGSSTGKLSFTPEQIAAIKQQVARPGQPRADFPISVGAAVPEQVSLRDLPAELKDALPDYRNNQYVMVRDRFVLVESRTRRVVAIVPVAS